VGIVVSWCGAQDAALARLLQASCRKRGALWAAPRRSSLGTHIARTLHSKEFRMLSQLASRRTPRRTSTTTPSIEGEPAPRLPHERDESSDSQQSGPRDVIRQAHDDVERGLVDTDRGPPLEETYRRTTQQADAHPPADVTPRDIKPGLEPGHATPGEALPPTGSPAASDHAASRDPPKR
jgi:hypothetical protein